MWTPYGRSSRRLSRSPRPGRVRLASWLTSFWRSSMTGCRQRSSSPASERAAMVEAVLRWWHRAPSRSTPAVPAGGRGHHQGARELRRQHPRRLSTPSTSTIACRSASPRCRTPASRRGDARWRRSRWVHGCCMAHGARMGRQHQHQAGSVRRRGCSAGPPSSYTHAALHSTHTHTSVRVHQNHA